jgi:hypothetical protein
MKVKLTANKNVGLNLKEPFFVPEKLSLKFESEYKLDKLAIEVKANEVTKNYIITDKKLDLTEFTQSPCIIEISIALIVKGKAVKSWEIEPILVEEVNHELVLKDYITSLTTPLQAEISTLKEQYQTLLNSYNELAQKHNKLALTVKAIKENY